MSSMERLYVDQIEKYIQIIFVRHDNYCGFNLSRLLRKRAKFEKVPRGWMLARRNISASNMLQRPIEVDAPPK